MVKRGLPEPVQITTDGSPGLIRAVEEVFPHSLRQCCLAHKTRNVTNKVPDSARAEVKAAVQAAYYAPNQEVARMIAADVLETYQALYPSAMKSFQDDWEACIAYLRCPRVHHKRIRTTNLLERSFLDERHRTKVIPRFFTEKSCLKPPSALLPISRSLRTPMKSPRSSGDAVHLSEQCDTSVSIIPSSGRHGQGSFPNRFPKSLPSVRSILWPCWKVC